MSRIRLEEIDWEFITQAIRQGKCVLCLGTEAYRGTEKALYHEALAKVAQRFPQDSELYKQEDLLYFKEANIKTRAYNNIATLYKETALTSQPLLEKLAEIDFHLIINLSPDVFLKRVFEGYTEKGLETQFDFYQAKKTVADIKKPTRQKPLLYNFFGSVEQNESLVFTHEDIFAFMVSILKTHELHDNLKSAIQEAECFLFVGAQLDHWYIKTLLQLLNFLNAKAVKYASPLKEDINEKFYYQTTRLEFIDENAQETWLHVLYEKCKEAHLLRDLDNAGKVSHKKELLEMLQNIDYAGFFAKLEELKIESIDISTFKMAFIKGRIDINFEERLYTYIQSLDI